MKGDGCVGKGREGKEGGGEESNEESEDTRMWIESNVIAMCIAVMNVCMHIIGMRAWCVGVEGCKGVRESGWTMK